MMRIAVLTPPSVPPEFRGRVTPFLRTHGFAADFVIEPVAGGGNNRVYRVQSAARAGLLKAYFQNPADPRDRFGTERAFYEFLWRSGVRRTPEPLGWEGAERLGLFTFVNGRKLRTEEITVESVGQALEFVGELNRMRTSPEARQQPLASEACFSTAEHLACVERRVARLEQIEAATALEREVAAFVASELKPTWRSLSATLSQAPKADEPLPPAQRCLSPSDFGFHNALLAEDGRLRFFDFEYAGWDDPAKLVCDFFCQPQVPVDFCHRDAFLARLAQALELDATFSDRARRLQPAYQVKWCCIMLNDFVRGDAERRDFAKGATDADERRRDQLEKARQGLGRAMKADH